ncbi:hypothetical protein CI109_107059 [Kwoniella shandongensis]|uniref:ER membrane protein complex subunit 2 n=1 Tax=Kwoniella shandongensis TaxID=1734106 RepID=A0A5M6BW34_9TREE|nr:uncharacterized protein CI109_006468 [Kwoniella shandongensis]KAA5525199.1 hypothetical protein CI109_006468 [Kwoniella shandongensis]
MSSSSSSDLEILAQWRTLGARHSDQVVEIATRVLKGSVLGEQEWSVREQLAIAALDLGQIKLANEQIAILHRKFPKSPRVRILDGLLLEGKGDENGAKAIYEDLLEDDETNVSAYQRLIALLLPSPSETIPKLLSYLDTFYSDPSGWSLLADLYAEQGMYTQSLGALGHLALINGWDEGVLRRSGEVAYTAGDYQLALKHFLRAAEMEGGEGVNPNTKRTRSWWGIKLAVRRLLESPNSETSVPDESRTTSKQLNALDELATERLLAAGGKGLEVRRKVLAGGEVLVR